MSTMGIVRTALVVMLLGACVTPGLVPCGDELCPKGDVCTPAMVCATQQALDACQGKGEGDPCDAIIGTGACLEGACRVGACGDGVIDPDEACDDGNGTDGDGCSRDCRSNETCGNGVRDSGEQCDEGDANSDAPNAACRTSCRSTACGDGVIDTVNGEACDDGGANSNAPGSACRENCQPQRCGDGAMDPGENCDDGNVVSGDGCSGDCASTEVCGNDYVDGITGEQCDSGLAGLSRDGCTSTCEVEIDAWQPISFADMKFTGTQAAYDSARGVVVLFGGVRSGASGVMAETWEWDGVNWMSRSPARSPGRRTLSAMAYDSDRHRVVLFSGFDTNDTWEYDGVTWTLRTLPASPGIRYRPAMAYDAERHQLLMFGGYDATTSYDELWAYDGTTWTRIDKPSIGEWPPVLTHAAMAYDPIRKRTVLFGGQHMGNGSHETWEWDGTAWSSTASTLLPDNTAFYVDAPDNLAWDAAVQRVVHTDPSATWQWDGAQWTHLGGTPFNGPCVLAGFDARSRVTCFDNDLATGKTYELASATWSLASSGPQSPGNNSTYSFAADPIRGKLVMYGGPSRSSTWEWNGTNWLAATPGPTPARGYGAMAYDRVRQRMILFGGSTANADTWIADTWERTGPTWSQVTPSASPPALAFPLAAYDAKRQLVVLVGSSQTWEYDGTTWTQRTPAHAPSLNGQAAAMIYDDERQLVVAYGGAKTYTYDGTDWSSVDNAPFGSRDVAFVGYDPARGASILFGGKQALATLGETWAWNGATWQQQFPSVSPTPRFSGALAYDSIRRALVVYGGLPSATAGADTWTYSYQSGAHPAEACRVSTFDTDGDGLAGCADPDCWGRCDPTCPPRSPTCVAGRPRCGDGACNTAIEDYLICPGDCPIP
ncbi:MAG TPA: DUF4215 domain-containing protein [Kofleriaceae bacterium]|jgi:cysteine-rich repeat protein